MKKTMLSVFLSIVLLLLCVGAALASPMPGTEDAAFAAALEEDKLRLKPYDISINIDNQNLYGEITRLNTVLEQYEMETYSLLYVPTEGETAIAGDDFYSSFSFYSLFSGGNKMLLTDGHGLAMVYDGDSGEARSIVPVEGLDPEYCGLMYSLLCKPEPAGVAWSSDGRYIALSFLRNTLLMARLDCNLLLIDTEEGTVRPLLDLPYPVKAITGNFFGAPFRAVFDTEKPVLYYEMYRVPNAIAGPYNQLRAYDLTTGETRVLSLSDFSTTTSDPALLVTPLGIANTYAHIKMNEDFGIAFRGERSTGTYIHGDPESPIAAQARNSRLLAVSDTHGLLLTGLSGAQPGTVGPTIHLFALDGISAALYDTVLSIQPDNAPQERLAQANLADLLAADAAENVLRPQLHNAVFSPDGNYILLAYHVQGGEYGLYIHDIARGVTGRIDLSAAFETSPNYLGAYGLPFTNADTGMHWLPDGRIMLAVGDGMRIFELSIAE